MTPLYTEFSMMLKTFTHTGYIPHLWCGISGLSMAARESQLRGDDLVLPFRLCFQRIEYLNISLLCFLCFCILSQ